MAKQTKVLYILGVLTVLILALVAVLAASLVSDAFSNMPEKPRFDLPDDIPWEKIPWKEFPEGFPYDEVPWEDMPDNTPWEDVPWMEVPWVELPDDLAAELPLDKIPWDTLPEDMPWEELPRDLPWEEIPWEDVPWEELPDDFPWEEVPWEDLPQDFNWQALTCEHEFGEPQTYIPATCITPGVDLYTCVKCDFAELRSSEPTNVHVYEGEWLERTAPTCTEEGLAYRVCVQCLIAEETSPIDPTGIHTYDEEWIEVEPATCVTEGLEHKFCNQCGGEEITQRINPTGVHKFDEATGKCINCDARQLTVGSASSTKIYDGLPLAAENCDILFGELAEGHDIVAVYTASRTDVGITDNLFTVEIVDEEGNNVTDGYEITLIYGTLTVTQRQLTVTTKSLSAIFDKTLECHEYEQTGLADGDEIDIIFTAKLTERGTCANEATVRIMRDGRDVTANYAVTLVFGTLTAE